MAHPKHPTLRRLTRQDRRDVAAFARLLQYSQDLIAVMNLTPRSGR